MSNTIIGSALPNIPWEEKPKGYPYALWRSNKNPLIGWNPTLNTSRIYNSAPVPFEGGFAGVFRADERHGRAALHAGRSKDGFSFDIDDKKIEWVDENGNTATPS